jgi:uncharacterized protein DUF3857/transglutaminase superfamily protein
MKKVFLGFFCLATVNLVSAHNGEDDYAVSRISPVLIKNANAVTRLSERSFEFRSTKEAIEKKHWVITIMNENGDEFADFVDGYGKLIEINSVEGFLYDANGKLLKKVKTKEMQDLSGVGESSLMEDTRVKHHNFYYKVYPYTVEYNEEITYKYTLFFPDWMPQGREKLSVEKSSFTIVCPAEYKLRYKSSHYTGEPTITTDNNKKLYSWSVNNLPAVIKEVYAPRMDEITTKVITGPSDFQVGNYVGNMVSWQDFGKFIYALKDGRDQLPENVKQTVHLIADRISDPKKKIEALYEYMQKNTRYISIQLGIGGWQPFDASYVATKGYGDCKALTNYMYSILKEVGIPSNYTLIHAGELEKYFDEDFPSSQFNHVILSVPLSADTMWLECTSQTVPAGYLGSFTCDRYALMIDQNGGKLVRTPTYSLNDNLQLRKTTAKLDDAATLSVKCVTTYRAEQQDDLHGMIHYLTKDKIKEQLQKDLDFATYDVVNFEYKEEKSAMPLLTESLDLSISNYASLTGKRLFIMPNVMTRRSAKLKADEERKYDIEMLYPYIDKDSVELEVPAGFEVESAPAAVTLDNKFGHYASSVKVEGNKIYYYREMQHYTGRFPAKDYSALVSFYDAIYKADRNRVVLVKKDGN